MENLAFRGGEELVYKVYYNLNFIWIPAGEVRFNVIDTGSDFILRAVGKTYKSYEWFYKVDDFYETIVDKRTLLPERTMRNLKEGGYSLYEEMVYAPGHSHVNVLRGREKESAKEVGPFQLEKCTHDILSLLYGLRNLDAESFKSAGSTPIDFFLDKKVYNIELTYQGEERKRVKGLGKFDTYKVSPELVAGNVFNEGDRMYAWVSRDENKIPLMIESPLSVGSAKAVLKSYRGLRYDLSSKH